MCAPILELSFLKGENCEHFTISRFDCFGTFLRVNFVQYVLKISLRLNTYQVKQMILTQGVYLR